MFNEIPILYTDNDEACCGRKSPNESQTGEVPVSHPMSVSGRGRPSVLSMDMNNNTRALHLVKRIGRHDFISSYVMTIKYTGTC